MSTNLLSQRATPFFSPARQQLWWDTIRQSMTYGMIGGSSTLVDFVLFNSMLWLFAPAHTEIVILLSCLAALASSLNSYLGHQRWTFKHSSPRLRSFLTLYALTLGMNMLLVVGFTALLPLLISLSGVEVANLSKLLAVGGSGMAGFLGNKYWVFRA